MIGTHTPKLLNAKLKQGPLRVRLSQAVPKHLICSSTIRMRRELWALPQDAANMRTEKEQLQDGSAPLATATEIPAVKDGNVKQLLLPAGELGQDNYITTTPVFSCGVLHEVYQRIREKELPSWRWIIQPTPAAIGNHGEMLLAQGGALRLLRRGIRRLPQLPRDIRLRHEPLVQLTAQVQHMNLSGGMLSVGIPAITAIGGMVHSLERQVGYALDFSVGFTSMSWGLGATKTTNYRRDMRYKADQPGFSTEEITGSGPVVLLLRPKESGIDLGSLAAAATGLTRFAGGSMFGAEVEVLAREDAIQPAVWIADASRQVQWQMSRMGAQDALQSLLAMYGAGGRWEDDGRWLQPRNGFSVSATGYGLLSAPAPQALARSGYPFAWSESLFAAITQSAFPSWWACEVQPWGIYWKGI